MNTIKMIVTPAMAAEWLAKNTRNRAISPRRVEQYASEMSRGVWRTTHQGIAICEDGVLADGQHRLSAVVMSGMPVEMMVTFGVAESDVAAIDLHRVRKMHDVIRIAGLGDWGKDDVAIARMAARISSGAASVGAEDISTFCDRNADALNFVSGALKNKVRYLTTCGVGFAIFCAYGHTDTARLEKFCKSLLDGLIEGADEMAVIRLRERLMTGIFTRGASAMASAAKLTMRAISAHQEGQRLGKLIEPKEFLYPVPPFYVY